MTEKNPTPNPERGLEALMLGFSFLERALAKDEEGLQALLTAFSTKEILAAMNGTGLFLLSALGTEQGQTNLEVLADLRSKILRVAGN